jgi:adenine-specific DNA-methyltransferase
MSNPFFEHPIRNSPYGALKTTLWLHKLVKAKDKNSWSLQLPDGDRPRRFERRKSGRIAVKIINHVSDEVREVFNL